MLIIDMKAPSADRQSYGLVAESAGTLTVTGKGVINRSHAHVINIWRSSSCTYSGHKVVMAAQPVVISAYPSERPKDLGTVKIGDTVGLRVAGEVTWYTITAYPLANPVLIPAPAPVIHTGGQFERLPATLAVVVKTAGLWEASVHGDTATEIDVELPNAYRAASFASTNREWSIRLRDPITSLDAPVTLIITKDIECGKADCWCEPSQYVEV
jgi:hypothetical protein